MKLEFRQGLVQLQASPLFLTFSGGSVDLNSSVTDNIITFAHGRHNYLFIEPSDVTGAWTGPFQPAGTSWLYWDIDISTGTRTFGSTDVDPTGYGDVLPINPVLDEHFFYVREDKLKVWDGSAWRTKVRVFAGEVLNNASVTPYAVGSQIANTDLVFAGEILYDETGSGIKEYDPLNRGGFVHTESRLKAQRTPLNQYEQSTAEYTYVPDTPVAAGHCVSIVEGTTLTLSSYKLPERPCVGISITDTHANEVGRYAAEGVLTSEAWNFVSLPNTPIWVGINGEVTTVVPTESSLQRLGYVISENSILLDIQELILVDESYKDCLIPSPTPTMTPEATPVSTPTATVTPTATPVATATPTVTATLTPTTTVTPTVTPTSTVTPTVTPTRTPGLQPSPAPTLTPTLTPTMTVTPESTPAVTPAVTQTVTPNPTSTVTPTVTPTNTVTPTVTATVTPTVTPTPSTLLGPQWDGLVVAYELDGDDATAKLDAGSNGIDFVSLGGTIPLTTTTGHINDARQGTVAGSDMTWSATSALFNTDSFTILFWYDLLITTATYSQFCAMSEGSLAGLNVQMIASSETIYLRYYNASNNNATSLSLTGVPNTGWHFIAITYDNTSSTMSVSVDDGIPNTNVVDMKRGVTTNFQIGKSSIDSQQFRTKLDAVRFFDGVLSSGDITTHYNAGVGLAYPLI